MELIKEIKIEIERWIFRSRRLKFKKKDDSLMLEAIEKAQEHTKRTGTRLWVIKIQSCDYRIYTKSQVKAFFRSVRPIMSDVNYYHTNEYIVHITNKPL